MDDQNHALDHGQLLGEESVEDDAESGDGNDQQSAMPVLKHIIGFVQNHEALDHGPDEEGQ